MFNFQTPGTSRASRIQTQRQEKKQAFLNIFNNLDSPDTSSDDSIADPINEHLINVEDDSQSTKFEPSNINCENSHVSTYRPDDDDCYWNELSDSITDSSPPLFKNAHTSIKVVAKCILSFAIEFNLPKLVVERLLKLFKSLLPSPNLLPTTHTSLLKLIGETPSSLTKYYCNSCLKMCTIRSGKKYCANEKCKLMNQSLRNREISEVVTMDIKQQLKTIITRNISLFGKMEFSPPFDINCGSLYRKSSALHKESNKTCSNTICSITLNIHTDGAPLVRSTKSSFWPCLASVVELPPQVREKQVNIVVLSLWTSSIKPDVNLFMNDSIEQLLDLSTPFTLTINDLEFSVIVKTQLFLSDLPAKALFWKTINYNGYNACSYCMSEGMRLVIFIKAFFLSFTLN